MPSSERCEGCGAGPAEEHRDHCPAIEVRVTDKRAQARAEADLAALQSKVEARRLEGQQAQEEAPQPKLVDIENVEERDGTYRQQRIEELRTTAAERDLTKEEAAEYLRLQSAESNNMPEGETVELVTAFLVLIDHAGNVRAESDVNILMSLDRLATMDDMDAGCHVVLRDIQASATAKQVVFGLGVAGHAIAEKKAASDMAARLSLGGKGRKR